MPQIIIMRHLLTIAAFLLALVGFSQAPQGINYQAVAHDNSGEPLSGQTITVRIGILSSSSSGTLEWEETHGVTTNSYGLFDLVVGMGASTGGGNQANFSDINWGTTSHFMRVEVDGGSGYESIGTMQLLSVPYALHAKTVENDQVDDADADASNELITGGTLNGTDLEITDAGGTTTIDLSGLSGGSGDDWGAQVVDSDATLNGDGTAASPLSVNGDLTDDQTLTYTAASQSLDISGGNSVTLSVDDADADPNNELLTGGTLSGTDLIISDAGGNTTIDLSPLYSSDTLPIIKNAANTFVSAINNNQVEMGFAGTAHYIFADNNRISMPVSNGNLFMANVPGGNSLGAGAGNIGIGNSSLNNITSGNINIGIGQAALASETTGGWNVGIGLNALQSSNGGVENVAIGRDALPALATGADNIAIGSRTLELITSGNTNIALGRNAGAYITGGSQNVLIGYNAGSTGVTTSQTGNIKIGAGAGANDTGNNKLYIDNQGVVMPLIYGNLASDSLKIFGSLSVGEEYTFPLADGNAGEVLSTDGAGQLSWGPVSGDTDWSTGAGFIYNNTDYVGIGTATPSGSYQLTVLQNAGNGINNVNTSTGAGATYGIRNELIGTMTGDRYAQYNDINNGSSGNWYGTWNAISPANGSTNTITGTYNNFTTGNGRKIGLYNNFAGSGSNLMEGVANYFAPDGSISAQAITNNIFSNAGHTGVSYGARTTISGGTGLKYGYASDITPSGTEFTYAFYSSYSSANPNTYGVYTNGEVKNYFSGNLGIGINNPSHALDVNGTGEFVQLQIAGQYVLPTTDGSPGEVMTTDGAGNASWKPKSVSFYAGMEPAGSTQTVSQNVQTTLVFQSGTSPFALNDGGGYNNASGQFQAPVAGVYQFNINVITAGAPSGYFKLNLVHSSGNHIAEKNGFFNTITQNWNSETINVTVHLNAGESVWVEMYNTNGGASFYRGQSSFSGHLVYAD